MDDRTTPQSALRYNDSAQIKIYPGGPMLVRGDVEVIGSDGQPLARRRRVTALCRCGHSAIPPLCDGNHKLVPGFGRGARNRGQDGSRT